MLLIVENSEGTLLDKSDVLVVFYFWDGADGSDNCDDVEAYVRVEVAVVYVVVDGPEEIHALAVVDAFDRVGKEAVTARLYLDKYCCPVLWCNCYDVNVFVVGLPVMLNDGVVF